MGNPNETSGTVNEPKGGHGGDQAKEIAKIVDIAFAGLEKQLGDHPNVNKANLVAALNAKLATLVSA